MTLLFEDVKYVVTQFLHKLPMYIQHKLLILDPQGYFVIGFYVVIGFLLVIHRHNFSVMCLVLICPIIIWDQFKKSVESCVWFLC